MSSVQQTLSRLRELRLASMAEAYQQQLQQPKLHELGFDDRLGLLVEYEVSERESRKLRRLIRSAGLPDHTTLEDIDYRATRGIEKSQIARLANCEWIRQKLNLIILGATGVGKTCLASAFGSQACRLGFPVSFYRASDLYELISSALLDGSLPRLRVSMMKPSLLIIDDFGLNQASLPVAQILLDIVDSRMRTGSLLITSQFPTDQWHILLPDPTLADAILDRIVHQSHRLTLKGESMRKMRAQARIRDD